MDQESVRSLLERIATLGVDIVREPETGLVMMDVTDCFNTNFHLGEVLATTSEVRLGEFKGWSMVMGDDGDRSLLLSCIDALFQGPENSMHVEMTAELNRWYDKAETELAEELKRAAATRVNFESMATE